MNSFKDYLNQLLHADSVTEVLMENRKETVKLAAIAVLILMVVLLYLHNESADLAISEAETGSSTAEEQLDGKETGDASGGVNAAAPAAGEGVVYVDVDGAVKEPQLVELPSGSRVEDAIQAAGGLTKKADLTNVNRAQILSDGEKIYIPVKGEAAASAEASGGGSGTAGSNGASSDGKININTADANTLEQIYGVGPVTARKIIDYREQHGSFQSIEELKNISGIGEKTFEKMQDYVTI